MSFTDHLVFIAWSYDRPSTRKNRPGDGQQLPSVHHGRPEGIKPLRDGLRLDLEQRLAVQGRDTTQMVHKPSGDDQRMPSGSHGRPEMAHAN